MTRRLSQPIFLAIMLLALAPFGLPELKLGNLGDVTVDVAFQLAMPYFIEQHLQFGEQVVFTYGPWGILLTGFTGPSFHTFVLLFHAALVVTVFLAFFALAERYSSRVGRAAVWVGAIALVLTWITGQRDSYFVFPALLVAYQSLAASIAADENGVMPVRRWETLIWVVLSLLSGWVALAKFNIFVVASVAHLLVLADDVRRRRWPVLPFVFVVALLLAWLGAGQSLSNLPVWVSRSLDLSNGYADAMSKGFFIPYDAKLVAVYYAAVVSVALVAVAAAAWHRWRFPALLSLLFTLFLCVIAVKHGMGGNQIEQSLALLGTVLWFVGLLFCLPSEQGAKYNFRGWRWLAAGFALTAALCLAVVAARTNFPIGSLRQAMANISGKASLLTHSPRDAFTDGWDAALAQAHRFWRPSTVPTGQTIDVYPQQTGLVIGREGLRYSPRPAFLSLNAHTYALAMLNARYLEESTAPDLVLFQVLPKEQAVNNRHPALADGPSWPLLWSRYDLVGFSGEFLVLRKRADRLQPQRRLVVERKVTLGEQFTLPHTDSGLIWAEINIQRTFLGKLIHMAYKSPYVLISTHTTDNTDHTYQLVPELGAAGFLLSPLVENTLSFAQIQRRGIPSRGAVKSVKISSPDAPPHFWSRDITLRLFELSLPPTTMPNLTPEAERLLSLQLLNDNTTNCLFSPRLEQLNDTKQHVLALHAPCQTGIAVSSADHAMTIKFGLQDSAFSGVTKTDGVVVQVIALKSSGEEYRRWSWTLDPATNKDDRRTRQMTITWPDATIQRIAIKILAGAHNNPSYDHAYIQDVSFKER